MNHLQTAKTGVTPSTAKGTMAGPTTQLTNRGEDLPRHDESGYMVAVE